MEDQHASIPAAGKERPDPGIQVRGIRGRVNVRSVSQESIEPIIVRRYGMRRRLITCTAMAAVLLLTTASTAAQTGKAYKPPRTADGHPDLQGMYDLATITPLERPAGAPAVYGKEEARKLETAAAKLRERGDQTID